MDKILIIGTNDIATACAVRLFRSGFHVCLISNPIPFDIFYFRNYSSVFPMGSKIVNGVKALTYADFIYNNEKNNFSLNEFITYSFQNRQIPVLNIDDFKKVNEELFSFFIAADSGLIKLITSSLTGLSVISCLPDKKDINADYFVYSKGNFTGMIDYPFVDYFDANEQNTFSSQFAESEGIFSAEKSPGDMVKTNERIGILGDTNINAKHGGYISGLMRSGIFVPKGMELIRIETQQKLPDVKQLPSASFAVAGGVLEAIMYYKNQITSSR